MVVLLDSNILLRACHPLHPHFPVAMRAMNGLRGRSDELAITQQNVVEFWSVATRPQSGNGLGLTAEQTIAEFETLNQIFTVLPEVPLHAEWLRLVTTYRVSGKNVHDARLVAAMVVHGVEQILTFNGADFARYAEISVLDPFQIS